MTFRGLTEVVKICSSRAVFAKMTTLSSNACVLYAQPRVSHLKAPGNRRCPQRRGVFTLTVRGIFAESGGFESSPTYQELQNNDLSSTTYTRSGGQRNEHQQQELVTREQQLWQRQEALWQQQLAHWQHEREMFIQREQALLVHIQELHSHLIAVTTQTTQSTQPGDKSSSESVQDLVTADRHAASAEMPATMNAKAAAEEQLVAASVQRETLVEAAINQPDLQREKARAPESSVTDPSASDAKFQVPQGPPPPLSLGSDDIYWVHQLQSGLMNQGYHSGEEEMEDFIFESGTESAVLAYQACAGLEESGVADEATWRALLGDKYKPTVPPVDEEILEETAGLDGPVLAPTPPSTPSNTSEATPTPPSTPKRNSEAKDANPWEASWGDLLSSQESDSEFDTDSSQSSTSGASTANAADSSLKTGAPASTPDAQAEATGAAPQWKPYVNEDTDYTKWTVLREGDGGRHVHELQVALMQKGFWPGEDDMLWWQFGDATCSAVQTFQATANLPESGVVTSDTWQALLGKDAKPIDAKNLVQNDETDDDMTASHDGMVYLIGEQRWERRSQPTL